MSILYSERNRAGKIWDMAKASKFGPKAFAGTSSDPIRRVGTAVAMRLVVPQLVNLSVRRQSRDSTHEGMPKSRNLAQC